LTYNKARQASITNEILEIVGGADVERIRKKISLFFSNLQIEVERIKKNFFIFSNLQIAKR
jgi:hypothetical protein